ncbi:MAG: hypothetical protein ACT4PZ_04100 [Panacagrimonas sp.]
MNRSPRTPPPGAVGALVAALGFGIAGWYGWAWYQLPRWPEEDIRASVEFNLVLDLSRRSADSEPVTLQEQDRLRTQVRQEVEAEIAKEREEPRGYTMAGLIIGVFGLLQMSLRNWLARRSRR